MNLIGRQRKRNLSCQGMGYTGQIEETSTPSQYTSLILRDAATVSDWIRTIDFSVTEVNVPMVIDVSQTFGAL